MAKPDLSCIRRPAPKTITRKFSEPSGIAWESTFRVPGAMELVAATDSAREYGRRYTGPNAENLPPVDGQPVFVSESSCLVAGVLQYLQTAPEDDRLSFEEIVSLMTVDALCTQFAETFEAIQIAAAAEPEDGQGPLA